MAANPFNTFGELLKYLRRRARLTQLELAIQVGYSEAQISRLENNQRPPERTRLAALFIPALGLEDDPSSADRLLELASQVRAAGVEEDEQPVQFDPFSVKRSVLLKSNLPRQASTFIGREKEIDQVEAMAQARALVTLTGSGGVGKTRLALQVCEKIKANFPDGVWLVELASINDPAQVARLTLRTFGLQEISGVPVLETLFGYLENRSLLLVFDNCEHLLPEIASLVDQLLRSCRAIHVLATSRVRLSVPGEYCFRVPSLAVADPNRLPALEALAQFESTRLFVERAAQVVPDFHLTEKNARAVGSICQRLDGIPLAIELAAARSRVLSVEQIHERLDQVFTLLTSGAGTAVPRQQTLKAAIDWSFVLLSQKEQVALQRLSVFSGGWTLEAAEQVCSYSRQVANPAASANIKISPAEVLDLLTTLVDQSLVLCEGQHGGACRYRMLETIRLYAQEKLWAGGEGEPARDAHLDYFLRLGHEAYPHLLMGEQALWMDELDAELENLRLALEWSLFGRLADGLSLIYWLAWFLRVRHAQEGAGWVERLIRAEAKARGGQPLPAGVPSQNDRLAWCRGIYTLLILDLMGENQFAPEETSAMLDEALASCRPMKGDAARETFAFLLTVKSWRTIRQPDSEPALRLYEEALTIIRQLKSPTLPHIYEHYLGIRYLHACSQRDYASAYAYLEECVLEALRRNSLQYAADCLATLPLFCYCRGEFARGRAFYEEAIQKYREIGNEYMANFMLINRAHFEIFEPELRPETLQQAQQALAFFREVRGAGKVCFGLIIFARLEWSRGNIQQAEAYWHEADRLITAHQWGGFAYDQAINAFWLAFENHDLVQAGIQLKAACQMAGTQVQEYDIFTDLLDKVLIYLARAEQALAAARLSGALDARLRREFMFVAARQSAYRERALTLVRQALGEETFQTAFQEGEAWSVDHALQYGLTRVDELLAGHPRPVLNDGAGGAFA